MKYAAVRLSERNIDRCPSCGGWMHMRRCTLCGPSVCTCDACRAES